MLQDHWNLLNELVMSISAICTTVIVSIRYPNDDSNLKKCKAVEQYVNTVLAANLSNNLLACSAKLGDECRSMYTAEDSPRMFRSETNIWTKVGLDDGCLILHKSALRLFFLEWTG